MPERRGKMDKFAGLDEETKEKVQTIMEEQKSRNDHKRKKHKLS